MYVCMYNFYLNKLFKLFILLKEINKIIKTCKDQIWYESKTGMDPGPRSPNNEFIECRSES